MLGSRNKKGTTSAQSDSGTQFKEKITKNSSNGSKSPGDLDTIPQSNAMIDDCFTVKRQGWGTFVSVDKDGKGIVTALTEEICIASTRWYLQLKQEEFTDNGHTYDGVVGGKL